MMIHSKGGVVMVITTPTVDVIQYMIGYLEQRGYQQDVHFDLHYCFASDEMHVHFRSKGPALTFISDTEFPLVDSRLLILSIIDATVN